MKARNARILLPFALVFTLAGFLMLAAVMPSPGESRGGGVFGALFLIGFAAIGCGMLLVGLVGAVRAGYLLVAQPDPGFSALSCLLVSLCGYGASASVALDDSRDCQFRRAASICSGAAFIPLAEPTDIHIALERTEAGSIDVEAAIRSVPELAQSWMFDRAIELNAHEAVITLTSHWELLRLQTANMGTGADAHWTFYARAKKAGSETVSFTSFLRRVVELSATELLVITDSVSRSAPRRYEAHLLGPDDRALRRLSAPADWGDEMLPRYVFALPDGGFLFANAIGTPNDLLMFRRAPMPQLIHVRSGIEWPSIFHGGNRTVMADYNENGAYSYSETTAPPGATNALVVAGPGVTCVGTSTGACLLPTEDALRAPEESLRFSAGFGTNQKVGLVIAILQIVVLLLLVFQWVVTRRGASTEADEVWHASAKRNVAWLGLLGIVFAFVFTYLFIAT